MHARIWYYLLMFGISVTDRCHMILAQYISPGDTVIDCTCGNGGDTLFLAKATGSSGKVLAFDVQEQAINNTRTLLKGHGLESNVILIHDSHDDLKNNFDRLSKQTDLKKPSVIMFNLGYLPGADHEKVTETKSTISAVKQSLGLLADGGILSVITYPGHDEGACEDAELSQLFSELSPASSEVLVIDQHNRAKAPKMYLVKNR